jgi:hypothetical protein
VKQLLTPAWDTASVKWKQMALARGQHHYTGVKSERIERAIADDLAFLATHPVRRSNSEAIARRREFKDTVRQRIKDVAEALDISVEDIRPALTLKHQEIGKFGEEHGVSLDWLLAGEGRFKKDVVGATPPADQEAIRAKVCEILQERGL